MTGWKAGPPGEGNVHHELPSPGIRADILRLANSTSDMRILYLAHRIPFPPNKGEKIRAFHVLRHLAARHEVWCACFVDDPSDRGHVPELAALCHRSAAIPLNRRFALARGLCSLAAGRTLTEGFYSHRAMRRQLAAWSGEARFDVVVAFSSSMAPYALTVPAARRVLDLCDLDSVKWRDFAARSRAPWARLYAVEARRLRRREEEWITAFDASVLISDAEAEQIDNPSLRRRVHVVPNGIAVPDSPEQTTSEGATLGHRAGDDRAPSEDRAPSDKRATSDDRAPSEEQLVVGFVGDLGYTPNVDGLTWFVRESWPVVRAAVPDAALHIIGRRPPKAVLRLGRCAGVEVIGEVPDVRPFLSRTAVSIAPLRIARGVQNKVLEAMAFGIPVVLTTPAATGIRAEDGAHWIIADDALRIAAAVTALLQDAPRRRQMGRAAREHVGQHYAWEPALAAFERIVKGEVTVEANRARAVEPRAPLAARACAEHGPS